MMDTGEFDLFFFRTDSGLICWVLWTTDYRHIITIDSTRWAMINHYTHHTEFILQAHTQCFHSNLFSDVIVLSKFCNIWIQRIRLILVIFKCIVLHNFVIYISCNSNIRSAYSQYSCY
jgi:hypothetical protein